MLAIFYPEIFRSACRDYFANLIGWISVYAKATTSVNSYRFAGLVEALFLNLK